MVLPIIGALAGAAGSIGSALIGANAQSTATQYNWMANLYNLAQRRQERRESMDYADTLRREQQLGGTDAFGNRSYFKPGQGWVQELAPEQRALMEALVGLQGRQAELSNRQFDEAEQRFDLADQHGLLEDQFALAERQNDFANEQYDLFQYFTDEELPERQQQFKRQARRSEVDDDLAQSYLDQFRRTQREDTRDVESLLYDAGTRGISEGMRDVLEPAMRSSLRTGATDPSKIITDVSREAMRQRNDASMNARLQARDYADERFNARERQALEMYGLLADRSDRPLGASYDPRIGPGADARSLEAGGVDVQNPGGAAGGGNALMNAFAQLAQQGNSQGLTSRQMTRGTLQDIEPDLSMANAIGAIGSSLGGLGERVGSYSNQQDMNELLKRYITSGGQIGLDGGGIYGMMTDRLRQGGSVF